MDLTSSWRRVVPGEELLIRCAAIIQRARAALPPNISRMTTDERGFASQTPFGILHQSAEKKDSYYVIWLVPGQQISPAEHAPYPCVCGVTVDAGGLHFLSAGTVSKAVTEHPLRSLLSEARLPDRPPRIFAGDGAAESPDDNPAPHTSAAPSPPLDGGATGNDVPGRPAQQELSPPKSGTEPASGATPWNVKIIEQRIDQFFEKANQGGWGLLSPHQTFYRSAGSPTPAVNEISGSERAELKRMLLRHTRTVSPGLWDKARLYRGQAPFYRGYEIIWFTESPRPTHRKPRPWWIIPSPVERTLPALECTGKAELLQSLNQQLAGLDRLALDEGNCAGYFRFVLGYFNRAPIEAPYQLLDYPRPVREALARHVRPAVLLRATATEWFVACFSEHEQDIHLSLWRIRRDGRSELLLEYLIWASPERHRELRDETDALGPLFTWQLAAALHGDAFAEALQSLAVAKGACQEKLWKRILDTPPALRAEAGQPVGGQEHGNVRAQLKNSGAGIGLPDEPDKNTTFESLPLPFYSGWRLYTLELMRRTYRFVARPDLRSPDLPLLVLDGNSRAIHAFNSRLSGRGELAIAQYPAEYLRFFGAYVHSEQGAFNVVESVEDLDWRHQTKNASGQLSRLLWRIVPLQACGETSISATDWTGQIALLTYGRDLYVALFKVFFGGMVGMVVDAPLLVGLPIYPHAFEMEQDAAFVLGANDESDDQGRV
jgi:hypothetical protein